MGTSVLSTVVRLNGVLSIIAGGGVPIVEFLAAIFASDVSVRLLDLGGEDH